MKTYYTILSLFLWIAVYCTSGAAFSQVGKVGINTTNPRTALEVAGDMQISEIIKIGGMLPLKDTDTGTFLIQDSERNILALDVSNPTGTALAYIQEYYIVNPNLDWVRNFDTNIDSTDYVVIVTSAGFDQELDLSESGMGPEKNASLPYATSFIENGTWHLKADYPQAANIDENAIGTWTITTLIFSADIAKQFGTLNIPMSNTSTGSATIPIVD